MKKTILYVMLIAATLAAESAYAQVSNARKRQIDADAAAFDEEFEEAMGRGKPKAQAQPQPAAATAAAAQDTACTPEKLENLRRSTAAAAETLQVLQNEQHDLRQQLRSIADAPRKTDWQAMQPSDNYKDMERPAQSAPQYQADASAASDASDQQTTIAPRNERFFKHRYRGWDLNAGTWLAAATEMDAGYTLHLTLDYCYNRYIQLGAGLGIGSMEDDGFLNEHGYYDWNSYDLIPVFVQIKMVYPRYMVQPFFVLQGGLVAYMNSNLSDDSGMYGYFASGVGVQLVIKRFTLYTQLGIHYPFAGIALGGGIAWRFGKYK